MSSKVSNGTGDSGNVKTTNTYGTVDRYETFTWGSVVDPDPRIRMFFTSRIRIRHYSYGIGSGSVYNQAKKVRKTSIFEE